MTIDPRTGLPELALGYFWQITEHEIIIWKKVPPSDWVRYEERYTFGLGVKLQHKVELEPREVKSWLGLRKTTQVEEIKYSRRAPRDEVAYAKEYYTSVNTEENILDRCAETLVEWYEEVKRNNLYGMYPPKKFEGSNSNAEA